MMHAGELREVLDVRRVSRTQRADGGYNTSAATLATVRAHVKAVAAREGEHDGRLESAVTYIISTYRRSELTTDDFLVWTSAGDIEMNIREIRLPPTRPLFMEIVAQTGVAR